MTQVKSENKNIYYLINNIVDPNKVLNNQVLRGEQRNKKILKKTMKTSNKWHDVKVNSIFVCVA